MERKDEKMREGQKKKKKKRKKSVRDIKWGMRERENVKYSDVIALRLSGRAIMDLHRPAASSLSGYDMMAEFWPRLAEPGCGERRRKAGRAGRAGCSRARARGCGLVCFNRADVTAAGGPSGPLSCHSSGWVSRREPDSRPPDYRVVTIAVRLLTTWHPRTLHPFKCCFVSLRQIGELPSSKRRVRDGYERKKDNKFGGFRVPCCVSFVMK